ncbi:MAG: SsrA-binding protein [candidate division TM6 bacterium GW2011_GWE2_41_16]|nr:MAG: SsrA-binding protein [candidate division TM6 bacterium GW2011_GWE2_41_16]
MKIITKNKKAFFDYSILSRLEAGIVLTGDETKAVRANNVNLTGTFATFHGQELFLMNCHIGTYSHAFIKNDEQTRRSRKLLLHKKELIRLIGDVSRKGITIVPLALYINEKGKIKVELGIAKHKKAHERKEELRERDITRETARELKNH